MNRGMLLLGPFTEADFRRFADLLREVERERPEELFAIVMVDDSLTLDEATQLVRRTLEKRSN